MKIDWSKWFVPTLIGAFSLFIIGMFVVENYIWKKAEQDLSQAFEDEWSELEAKLDKVYQGLEDTINVSEENLAIKDLKLDVKSLEQQVKANDSNLRSDFYWLLKIGLPATFLGLLIAIYGFYKSVYQIALEQATEEAQKAIMDDRKYQKTYAEILVLRKAADNADELVSVLKNHKFKEENINSRIYEPDNENILKLYDAIILLGNQTDFEKKEVEDIFNKKSADTVLLKLQGKFVDNKIKNSNSFSSATMISQLYPNLMNLLIYKQYNVKNVQEQTSQKPQA